MHLKAPIEKEVDVANGKSSDGDKGGACDK